MGFEIGKLSTNEKGNT